MFSSFSSLPFTPSSTTRARREQWGPCLAGGATAKSWQQATGLLLDKDGTNIEANSDVDAADAVSAAHSLPA